jgi:hypothetical protein
MDSSVQYEKTVRQKQQYMLHGLCAERRLNSKFKI